MSAISLPPFQLGLAAGIVLFLFAVLLALPIFIPKLRPKCQYEEGGLISPRALGALAMVMLSCSVFMFGEAFQCAPMRPYVGAVLIVSFCAAIASSIADTIRNRRK